MLLRDFFDQHFLPLRLRSRADNTIRLYRTSLRTFDAYLQRPADLADLTDETIGRHLTWLRQVRRLSPYSVNKERANLLAIWRFAARKRLIDNWPDVDAERAPRRVPDAWTADQLGQLIAAAQRQPGTIGDALACHWWRCLILLLWDSGERISAILGLSWSDVDLDQRSIVCRAEHRKGGREDRCYEIAPQTAEALGYLPRNSELVLPWPLNRNYLWTRFGKLLASAGLPSDRRSKFHRIRRTVASYYEAAGGNATELLGHSSRAVTRAYLDPRIVRPRSAASVLFRPGSTDSEQRAG